MENQSMTTLMELKRFHWNHLNYCKDMQRVIAKAESEALGKRLRAETQHTNRHSADLINTNIKTK